MTVLKRAHLAHELHDGIAQDLAALGYSLDLLLAAPETPTTTRREIRTMRFRVTEILDAVRAEIHQLLRPTTATLAQRIEQDVSEICSGIAVDLTLDCGALPGDSDGAYEVSQIVREILRNTVTHAFADHLYVTAHIRRDVLQIEIADNGVGGAGPAHARFGIVGARARADNLGGELSINSLTPGTRVSLTIPVDCLRGG